MDSTRRTLLSTGAAAAAVAAAPRAFAQAAPKGGIAGPFYQKGDDRIHYQDTGSDFVHSVSGDVVRTCQTPVLIMPDDAPPHPYVIAMESAMLAPKSEVSLYPWKDTEDKIPLAVRQVRTFLRAHRPATA
jgi:hypothetical protein